MWPGLQWIAAMRRQKTTNRCRDNTAQAIWTLPSSHPADGQWLVLRGTAAQNVSYVWVTRNSRGKLRCQKNQQQPCRPTHVNTHANSEREGKQDTTHQVGTVELRVRSDKVLAVDHAHHALHSGGVHDAGGNQVVYKVGLGEGEGDGEREAGGQLVCGAGMPDCADEVFVVFAQSGTQSDGRKGRKRQVARSKTMPQFDR